MKTIIIALVAACLMVGCGQEVAVQTVDTSQMKIKGERGIVIGKMMESDAGDRSTYCYLIVMVGNKQRSVRVGFDAYSSIKVKSTVYVSWHADGKSYLDCYVE